MQIKDVALVGFMRSGKDSIADCLLHLASYSRKISFAEALKNEVATALNCVNDDDIDEDFFNEDANRPLYRPLLQWWGTEYRRGQDPGYWVRQVERIIDVERRNASRILICTDARFINELDMLKKQGFKLIHLDMNPDEIADYLLHKGMSREAIEQQFSHPSEREWQSYPKDIRFTSTFGNLPRLTNQVVTYLTGNVPDADIEQEIERFYAAKYPETYGPLAS